MKFYADDLQLSLRDIGLDCGTTLCSRTVGDLLQKAGEHVQKVHGMSGFSKDFYQKALASMQEGICPRGESMEHALRTGYDDVCGC